MLVSIRPAASAAQIDQLKAFAAAHALATRVPNGEQHRYILGARQLPESLQRALLELPAVAAVAPSDVAYPLCQRVGEEPVTVVRVGCVPVGGQEVIMMAGPCAVETQAQILAAAWAAQAAGAQVLRGGAFKPRTNPYAFAGLGQQGLDYLAHAKAVTGLPVITEVMAIADIERVAQVADCLQIGARNMQNYPLLRALGQQSRPVLLKRGLSATYAEWLMAAEYIHAQGNGQIILCERGIRTFEPATRNTLDLAAVPVLRELTHLPIVVDPSHGTGMRAWVAPMARAAVAAGADGLLIEAHPDPDRALSDGAQSLSLPMLQHLGQSLPALAAAVGRCYKISAT